MHRLFKSRIFGQATIGWHMIDRIRTCFFFIADSNIAGTGSEDARTGSGGIQPLYSGYAPPQLAQPTYPMHLPHNPRVSNFSSIFLFFI